MVRGVLLSAPCRLECTCRNESGIEIHAHNVNTITITLNHILLDKFRVNL